MKTNLQNTKQEILEKLRETIADIQHEQWSGWMEYLFSKGSQNVDGTFTIDKEYYERWSKQKMTPYEKLNYKEQESDRIEADKILNLLLLALEEYREAVVEEIENPISKWDSYQQFKNQVKGRHTIDIIIRKDGRDIRLEGEWIQYLTDNLSQLTNSSEETKKEMDELNKKIFNKICANCHQEIDRPVENAEEKIKMATSFEIGKSIYYAVLDKRFRSIELCNWCYSLMQAYRYTLSKEERSYKEKESNA